MRQFLASQACPRHFLAFAACCLLGLSACRKEEITSYSAPKETAHATAPAPAVAPMMGGAPAATPVHWTVPAGWNEEPASGMRVGSFKVNKDGQHADVSIIPLAGGTELDNVNRWRGQIGLPPIEAAALADAGEKITIGSTPSTLYDLAGSDPQTKQPARILAAMLPMPGSIWFFKMIGSDSLVQSEKPAFKQFLQSVHMADGPPDPASAMPVAAAPGAAMPDISGIPGHENLSSEKPQWTLPSGWQSQPATAMRLASFVVHGEGGAKADVSVVKLAGTGGGMLLNVNRWRGQVGLTPVDDSELQKLISTQTVEGNEVSFLDMAGRSAESGEQARLLVGIVSREGSTWFYKMVGNDQLVGQQKDAFMKFVTSAQYPHAP